MKVLSLFSGIGAFEKAFTNLEIPYEMIGFSEIDKYAVKSYCAIHGVDETMNLGDITKIDEKALPKDIDLITYGFPCQDISNAGKQKGLFNADGTQTRSGLFYEALRIIEATQPRVAIAENVKNLTSKKFNAQFQIVLESLEQAGYNNYWQVLNAKDYGIPQNRERVFIVSIRKDIDTGLFKFPEGFPLKLRLKDLLEDEVDESFYINEERTKTLQKDLINKGTLMIDVCQYKREGHPREYNEVALTLSARDYKDPRLIQVGSLDIKGQDIVKHVYSSNGLSPTLTNIQGGNRQPKILEEPKVICVGNVNPSGKGQNGTVIDSEGLARTITQEKGEGQKIMIREAAKVDYDAPTLTSTSAGNEKIITAVAMRGRYNEEGKIEQNIEVADREVANAITTVQKDSMIAEPSLRIRKLTPKECFRLMGFEDSDFEKAEAVNSNTQLYKQAGNSIVVPVVEHIIKALFDCGALEKEREEESCGN